MLVAVALESTDVLCCVCCLCSKTRLLALEAGERVKDLDFVRIVVSKMILKYIPDSHLENQV